MTYDTDDCSGDVKRVDVLARRPWLADVRRLLEGQFVSQLCESMVDDCCKKNWYIDRPVGGASVRMCLSEQSLNDAVATCAWIAPDGRSPATPATPPAARRLDEKVEDKRGDRGYEGPARPSRKSQIEDCTSRLARGSKRA